MAFEGFVPPTKNYFPVPNNWIDICATIRDISELKVIQYVIRHTWGFHEYGICKTISVDEFMHGRRRQDQTRMDCGTGLSEQSVRNGLNKAIKDGYLVCEVDPSDAGRIKKSYALRMQANTGQVQTLDPPQTLDPSTGTNFRPQGTNTYTSDSQSLDPRVPKFRPRTEKDTIEKHLGNTPKEKQEIVTSAIAGSDAPAATIHDIEVMRQRKTDPRIPVVSSHSQRLSEEETVKMPAVKKGQTDASVRSVYGDSSNSSRSIAHSSDDKNYPVHVEQTIPAGGDAAQRTIDPPQASTGTARSNGAVQASIPKRPRTSKKVTQAKPVITLSAQEQVFWDLWCGVWFNLDIPPDLTETAYGHVKKLAPFITTSEQLNSLIDYTRKDLAASQNIKRKMVQLGNMVFCYAGWKQAQQQPANNISKNGTDLNQYGLQALLQRQEQKAV